MEFPFYDDHFLWRKFLNIAAIILAGSKVFSYLYSFPLFQVSEVHIINDRPASLLFLFSLEVGLPVVYKNGLTYPVFFKLAANRLKFSRNLKDNAGLVN